MAEHGFQLRGEHGFLQIDGRYQNMDLTVKKTFGAPGGYSTKDSYSERGRLTKWNEILSPSTSIIAIDSNDWVVSIDEGVYQAAGANRANVTIYGFGTDKKHWFKSTHGLSVLNDKGQEVYNSNWAALRVVDVFNLGHIKKWAYQIPPGKQYAMVMSGGRLEYVMAQNRAIEFVYFMRKIGNRFEVEYRESMWWFRDEDENSYVAQDFPLSILILDVTGY
ncbi:hypothetical protein [Photorhabdus asymbiotica]|uniref:hypothetical protein n=1 Tax=Photorhabdus asymbiotica TaxID=291112 RepID=UPI003DA74301